MAQGSKNNQKKVKFGKYSKANASKQDDQFSFQDQIKSIISSQTGGVEEHSDIQNLNVDDQVIKLFMDYRYDEWSREDID